MTQRLDLTSLGASARTLVAAQTAAGVILGGAGIALAILQADALLAVLGAAGLLVGLTGAFAWWRLDQVSGFRGNDASLVTVTATVTALVAVALYGVASSLILVIPLVGIFGIANLQGAARRTFLGLFFLAFLAVTWLPLAGLWTPPSALVELRVYDVVSATAFVGVIFLLLLSFALASERLTAAAVEQGEAARAAESATRRMAEESARATEEQRLLFGLVDEWSGRLAQGDLDARLAATVTGKLAGVVSRLNSTAETIQRLTRERELAADEIRGHFDEVSRTLQAVNRGDLSARARSSVEEGDLGAIAAALNVALEGLAALTGTLAEVTRELAGSAEQLQAVGSEQAAASAQQAAVVAQTTTTVREVAQTAEQSRDSAREVATAAAAAVERYRAGQNAVEELINGIRRVAEVAEANSARINALAEEAGRIAEIVEAVETLARQSNLLALNAAIEAARAGAAGQGFAVVAEEVHALAEESQNATAGIRRVLARIREAAGEAVDGTAAVLRETGGGLQLASEAGDALSSLSAALDTAAVASERIAASADQQAAGMDQIAQAMGSVDQAAGQGVISSRQIEEAAKALRSAVERVRSEISRYRA
jgi:methyl-accepting chemotaxis protein